MKRVLIFVLLPLMGFCQEDSFIICNSLITEKWQPQYYAYQCKYPVSSEKLALQANAQLKGKYIHASGFVTIRFVVNCNGITGQYKVYQTDQNYQETNFDPLLTQELLDFIRNLNKWETAKSGPLSIDYYTYFTFKIEKGIINEIVH